MDNRAKEPTKELSIQDVNVVMVDDIEPLDIDALPKVDIYDKKRNKLMLQKFVDAGKKEGEEHDEKR